MWQRKGIGGNPARIFWELPSGARALVFGGKFEGHFPAESGSLPDSVGDAQCQPDGARDFRRGTQAPPDHAANHETNERHQQVAELLLAGSEEVVYEGCGVYSHKGNEGAEVQHLRAALIGDEKCANEGDSADHHDVVGRYPSLFLDLAEETFGDGVIAAHS